MRRQGLNNGKLG